MASCRDCRMILLPAESQQEAESCTQPRQEAIFRGWLFWKEARDRAGKRQI